MPGQTVQNQIRLEQSDQGLHCLPFVCIVPTHYSMVKPHSSNFRVITTNFLGVRIFRKFTVILMNFRIFIISRSVAFTILKSPQRRIQDMI